MVGRRRNLDIAARYHLPRPRDEVLSALESDRVGPVRMRSIGGRVKSVLAAKLRGGSGGVDVQQSATDESIFDKTLLESEKQVIADVRYFTMISSERLVAIMDAVRYLVQRDVPGAFVECGVWRGGAVLAMVRTLQQLGVDDRDIYLYDTFEGMTRPSEADTSPFEQPALLTWEQTPEGTKPWSWAFDPEIYGVEFVRKLMETSGYPMERIHFVVGPVEETIPGTMPEKAALVRLDTDWYESTRHELTHLYPRISPGGVLIIDDYGHWEGAKRAVEEYFASAPLYFARSDYSGRVAVKP